MKKTVTFLLLFAFVFALFSCDERDNHLEISVEEVEKITFFSQMSDEKQFTSEEIEAFVNLYNKSEFGDEATGDGGTPYYGATVYFKDGSFFRVNDFHTLGYDFEVSFYDIYGKKDKWFYVNNQELTYYMENII